MTSVAQLACALPTKREVCGSILGDLTHLFRLLSNPRKKEREVKCAPFVISNSVDCHEFPTLNIVALLYLYGSQRLSRSLRTCNNNVISSVVRQRAHLNAKRKIQVTKAVMQKLLYLALIVRDAVLPPPNTHSVTLKTRVWRRRRTRVTTGSYLQTATLSRELQEAVETQSFHF